MKQEIKKLPLGANLTHKDVLIMSIKEELSLMKYRTQKAIDIIEAVDKLKMVEELNLDSIMNIKRDIKWLEFEVTK